jgi:hypothetical protein
LEGPQGTNAESSSKACWLEGKYPAGKLVLIKSNISGMPAHLMSCFKLPVSVTKAIDKESRQFFWGKDTKLSAVAWKDICVSKTKGYEVEVGLLNILIMPC